MTYKYHITQGQLQVAMAPLSTASYAAGTVYAVGAWDGNISPSVTSGAIDLTEGEYLVEAFPFSSGGQNRYQLYLDSGSGYALSGPEGKVQTQSDTSDGNMIPAYTHVSVPSGSTYQIELRVVSTVSATDHGGYIQIWRTNL